MKLKRYKQFKTINELKSNHLPMIKNLEKIFNDYIEECSVYSSPTSIKNSETYKKILSVGEKAIAFLISTLRSGGIMNMLLLEDITNEHPVPEKYSGHVSKMEEYWKNWFEKNGR